LRSPRGHVLLRTSIAISPDVNEFYLQRGRQAGFALAGGTTWRTKNCHSPCRWARPNWSPSTDAVVVAPRFRCDNGRLHIPATGMRQRRPMQWIGLVERGRVDPDRPPNSPARSYGSHPRGNATQVARQTVSASIAALAEERIARHHAAVFAA
jgi:hypothetical protein